MKNLNSVFIIFCLFLFGCNQAETENQSTKGDKEMNQEVQAQGQIQEEVSHSQDLEDNQVENINNLIALFQTMDVDKISNKISYPLNRQTPIPSIENQVTFKKRFNEVFDKTLIDKMVNSKVEQWSKVGWRGIMLDNGTIWLDESGEKIIAINYQSDSEKQMKEELIVQQKEELHPSLKSFESPKYRIKTKNYLIRIDALGDYQYRYASWKLGEKESSKPDIILSYGKLEYQGSGGNHVFTFLNGDFTYNVYRTIIGGENSAPFSLEIEENGTIILTEDGELVTD